MSIIIGADIVPTLTNLQWFENGCAGKLVGKELFELLKKADYRIFNLEVPLTNHEKPISKMGPNLISTTASVTAMKAMGIDLFSLANNHIMDQDVQGLESTIWTLKQVGIAYVGAGADLQEACKPWFHTIKGKRYGIYSCAEHEFSIAKDNHPGANSFDSLVSLDHISEMKEQCDYAIVLYHGGKEHYRYPSPFLQKVCRRIVDKGADLVICQHSHCIGCKEEYRQGTIIYGQGNFIFEDQDNEFWNTSLLVSIDDNLKISYIPLRRQDSGTRIANGNDSKEILEAFIKRSEEIKDPEVVEKRYRAFAQSSLNQYLVFFSGKQNQFIYKVINKLSGHKYEDHYCKHYKKKLGIGMRNYIECEAHRELIIEGIKEYD